MGLLAIAYLAASVLADEDSNAVPWLIGALAVIFIVEFGLRFLDAPSKRVYLRHHWLDLVSAIPLVGGLRSLRLLRLLRLGAALRVLGAAEQAAEARGMERGSLWFVAPTLLLTWFAAAAAYWWFEHGVNPSVHTFGDALYWALITAMTVGYGGVTTVTTAGHVLAGAVIFVGIGLVGFSSARLTQHWLRDESRHHPRVMIEKLNNLEREIASLRELLLEQRDGDAGGPEAGEAPGGKEDIIRAHVRAREGAQAVHTRRTPRDAGRRPRRGGG